MGRQRRPTGGLGVGAFTLAIPHTYKDKAPLPSPLTSHRRWMAKVLQPLNEKAAQIATDNIDLLEGSTIEPLLLQVWSVKDQELPRLAKDLHNIRFSSHNITQQ